MIADIQGMMRLQDMQAARIQPPRDTLRLRDGRTFTAGIEEHHFLVQSHSSRDMRVVGSDIVRCGDDPAFVVRLSLPPWAVIRSVNGRPMYPSERTTQVEVGSLHMGVQLHEPYDGAVVMRIDSLDEPSLWMEVHMQVQRAS
jgi:hypothetical protein